jgi:6-pyruvoyltetrahydropterin/6-carboxytetrahydropterin synthase
MYSLTIESVFAAAHSIAIRGDRESVHGHHWHITATIEGESLDSDGLLCDFHIVERALAEVASKFHNRNLNEIRPFDILNPSAEMVARHIHEELSKRVGPTITPRARLASVRVTEAPGCAATYRP